MPAIATPRVRIASDMETVLKLVKAKLVDDGLIDPSRIFASLQPDEETAARAMADRFIKIFIEDFDIFQGGVTGGGDDLLVFEGTWIISLWGRSTLDPADWSDDNWLLDPVQGMLARFHDMLKALQLYDPQDAEGNYVLVEPMRLATTGHRLRKPKPVATWGRLSAPFEVKILQEFTDLV